MRFLYHRTRFYMIDSRVVLPYLDKSIRCMNKCLEKKDIFTKLEIFLFFPVLILVLGTPTPTKVWFWYVFFFVHYYSEIANKGSYHITKCFSIYGWIYHSLDYQSGCKHVQVFSDSTVRCVTNPSFQIKIPIWVSLNLGGVFVLSQCSSWKRLKWSNEAKFRFPTAIRTKKSSTKYPCSSKISRISSHRINRLHYTNWLKLESLVSVRLAVPIVHGIMLSLFVRKRRPATKFCIVLWN